MSELYYYGQQAMLKHGTKATPIPKVAADAIERLTTWAASETRRAELLLRQVAQLEKAIGMALTAIDAGESKQDIAAALQGAAGEN